MQRTIAKANGLMAAYHYQQGDRPLDGYTIQYALGRGGFGEVYFAVSDSGREVALKSVQNFEDVELRGIGHCMNLKSPHLVTIFDIKHADHGTPWVIMEYVSGPSLRDILDDAPEGLGIEQATFFLRELARGLSYLHEAGVVHRDMKPHNVFFEDGAVKIGDYSLSKVITTSHRSGNTTTVGSVHYMAPEISLGRYDKTVDIYALGVMLFEMLTGQPPYVGESMGEVLMKHLSSDPDVSQLSEPFAGAVVKAMQRDPADRFQTTEELLDAVADVDHAKPFDDSFNPATLSLVGERARKARAERAALQVAIPNVAADIAGPLSHSTAPSAVQDTGVRSDATDNTGSDKAGSAASIPVMHHLGLNYSPPQRCHDLPDSTKLVPRLLLAALTTTILMAFGMAMSGRPTLYEGIGWMGPGALAVSGVTCLLFAATTVIASDVVPLQAGIGWGLVSRVSWTLPVFLVWIGILGPLLLYDRLSGSLILSTIFCTAIFDWRCLTAIHRQPRISILPVLGIGVVAVLSHVLIRGDRHLAPFAGALAMAAALTVQLVAPVRRASINAPLIERPPKPGKPRLLYDKTAMFLELLVGAAVAFIIGMCFSRVREDELMVIGVVAGFVVFFALRFRLQRRAWPDQLPTGTSDGGRPPVATPLHRGRVKALDKTSVFLETIILAAVALVAGLILNGDDDLFLLGASAAIIGSLTLRFRLRRHRIIKRSRLTSGTRLSFDKTSFFLELLIGVCVVVIAAVIFEGDDDFFGFAAAAAALAVVSIRFRLARRIRQEQAITENADLPRMREMAGQNDVVREIR